MITRKQVIPYLVAGIVAVIGAGVAMIGVWLSQLARTNADLAAILMAGFVILAAFAKILPSPESIIHQPVTVINNTGQPIVVEHNEAGATVTLASKDGPPVPEGPPPRRSLRAGIQGHTYGESEVVAPGESIVVGQD